MDYKDYLADAQGNNFWFYRKTEFIGILLDNLKLNKDIKILNLGAGTGQDLETIKKFGDVSVLDIDSRALDLIPDNAVENKILADACDTKLPENSFDLILAFDLLEHIKDDKKAVLEVLRLLRPGGYFVFTVPAYSFLFSAHDKYLEHYRRYNKKDLLSLFNNLSFKKIELSNWFFFLFPVIALYRLAIKKLKIKHENYKIIVIPKFWDFIGNITILNFENFLFKKGVRYPFGSTFYGIYKKI